MSRVAFYAYSREWESSQEVNEFVTNEIVQATLGCYDVSNYHVTERNGEFMLGKVSNRILGGTGASREGDIVLICISLEKLFFH